MEENDTRICAAERALTTLYITTKTFGAAFH